MVANNIEYIFVAIFNISFTVPQYSSSILEAISFRTIKLNC